MNFEFKSWCLDLLQVVAQLKAGGQAAPPGSEEAALIEARLAAVKAVAAATGTAPVEAPSQPVIEVAGA